MNIQPSKNTNRISMMHKNQLIASATMLGVIVLVFLASITGGHVKSASPILAYLAVAFAAQVTAFRLFIPGLFVNSQLKDLKHQGASSIAERLQELFQTRMIISLALLVGAALFNLIAYVINGQWFSLATIVFLLILMGMMFPTAHKFEKWVVDIEKKLDSNI